MQREKSHKRKKSVDSRHVGIMLLCFFRVCTRRECHGFIALFCQRETHLLQNMRNGKERRRREAHPALITGSSPAREDQWKRLNRCGVVSVASCGGKSMHVRGIGIGRVDESNNDYEN